MAERILVPLDGSSLGEQALEYVNTLISQLSPKTKVTVVLLHVISSKNARMQDYQEDFIAVDTRFSEEEMEELKKKFDVYFTRVSKKLQGDNIEVKHEIVEGENPAEEIIAAEARCECDLVVMTTHGRSGLSRWAFGSVTEKVLRAGSVPVMLVRANKERQKA